MPHVMQLVPIGERLGVVLDVPPSYTGNVSIYTEGEIGALLAAEREVCAKIAEAIGVEQYKVYRERDPESVGDDIANAIRNRTQ